MNSREDLRETLGHALDEAMPHLVAAGRELLAALNAFVDALREGQDPTGPKTVVRVEID